MPDVADAFLQLLKKSKLVAPAAVDEFMHRNAISADASSKQVARAFVQGGLLTTYQAERLLQGRSRGFFVGDYKLEQILGFGGMGCVYIARSLSGDQRVALKILSERHRFDAGMLARLQLEADVRLDHPNIVQTYRIGHDEGAYDVYFIVMEFVEGVSLLELLNLQGRVEWPQACDFMCQAARGLKHAHRNGLVHRDIKPENLLIQRDGTVKVLDFGLSMGDQSTEDEFSLQMIFGHDCLGSADYMPPEQWENSSTVDARADLYSLGCTMYVTLAAAFPFQGRTHREKKTQHVNGSAKPLREIVPEIPGDVAAIVEKLMAPQVDQRFQSADELIAALEPLSQRRPVDFDFKAVLKERAAHAKKRMKLHESRTRRSSATRQSSTQNAGADSPRANTVETAVQRDTQPSHSTEPPSNPEFDRRQSPQPDPAPQAPPEPLPFSQGTAAAWLIPRDGSAPIELNQPQIVIGRQPQCDVPLDRRGVSGRHCELRQHGGWWHLVDLNSKNGVAVNGKRVSSQLLTPGDRLTIAGEHHFIISDTPEIPRQQRSLRPWLFAAAGTLLVVLAALAWSLTR